MTKDGRTLAEFTNGPDSGWLYKVNGILPDKGIRDFALSSQDSIVFYYTDDWTSDPSAGHFAPADKTETIQNPDGSVTTIVTKPNSSAVATTKKPDGGMIVVETQKNGAVLTTENRADGVKVDTTTDENGATAAKITVPANQVHRFLFLFRCSRSPQAVWFLWLSSRMVLRKSSKSPWQTIKVYLR